MPHLGNDSKKWRFFTVQSTFGVNPIFSPVEVFFTVRRIHGFYFFAFTTSLGGEQWPRYRRPHRLRGATEFFTEKQSTSDIVFGVRAEINDRYGFNRIDY